MDLTIQKIKRDLGRRLASLCTKMRVEDQGVVDLGEAASASLANLYAPGRGMLRMGYWRGEKVWDVWAAHAFALWGCNHLDRWQGLFHGLDGPAAPIEEALSEACLSTDPTQWRRIWEEECDYACNNRELFFSLYWVIGCLKDAPLARTLMAQLEREEKLEAPAWLIFADVRARAGDDAATVAAMIERAEKTAERADWLFDCADAWLGLLGDRERAAVCLDRARDLAGDYRPRCYSPHFALIFQDQARFASQLTDQYEAEDYLDDSKEAAIAQTFLADDRTLVDRYCREAREAIDSGDDGISVAFDLLHLNRDATGAHELLRSWAGKAFTRQTLYENADRWLEQTGDETGTRLIFQAARLRKRAIRSPHDWLEWVDWVLLILHDKDLAAEGLREAEQCARGELMHYQPLWNSIAKAWLKIERHDELERMLSGELRRIPFEELLDIAAVWMEPLHNETKARETLLSARAALLDGRKIYRSMLQQLGQAWIDILSDPTEAERDRQIAEASGRIVD